MPQLLWILVDSITSSVFCNSYIGEDFLTVATLFLTCNPVHTVLGGARDLAGDWPRFPCVSGGVGGGSSWRCNAHHAQVPAPATARETGPARPCVVVGGGGWR